MPNRKKCRKKQTPALVSDKKFLTDIKRLKGLALLLNSKGIFVFEYQPQKDQLTFYDDTLQAAQIIPDYLDYLFHRSPVHPDDREKVAHFMQHKTSESLEVRQNNRDGTISRKLLESVFLGRDKENHSILLGTMKDITEEKEREELLQDQARRDPLTGLYNPVAGKELINEYLTCKSPYTACGLLILDIDYFKNVNDHYGHLFGNTVLIELAQLLTGLFQDKDIIMRAGGDEFVILLKDIQHTTLMKKAMLLTKEVPKLTFPGCDYAMTCSVGACFLPENISGYTYNQLFENADWALYRAKEKGRNRYEFCDNLQRFSNKLPEIPQQEQDIDGRYLHNDIISTAFEIFERTNSFDSAILLLLKIIGLRFKLDRITIIQTDIAESSAARQYQWISPRAPEALPVKASFSKEDFLTLFHSYDEYGTTVLQYDDMGLYSPEATQLLMQGDAKTVLYAAMYCEGRYTGAISYVMCDTKRYWSKPSRSQLGELTKIISAHLAKSQAINALHQNAFTLPEYDSLTGLITFSRFHEEVERFILGGYAKSHAIIYSDIQNFKYFNQKYGYSMGDQLLKEFCNYHLAKLQDEKEVYFTRVFADQFIMFKPCDDVQKMALDITAINQDFIQQQSHQFPAMRIHIRTGIYFIEPDCLTASAAIDAANTARKTLWNSTSNDVCIYNRELELQELRRSQILNGLDLAIQQHEFQVYLQPRLSINDQKIIGAEALVRWHRPDGTILSPDAFIPLYEQNGRIVELDFYVFEQVVAFLAKNQKLGRKQVPISINASALHAGNYNTAQRYLDILNRYQIDPALTEIELTETALATNYKQVRQLFQKLQQVHIRTTLDDFGSGYSVLNTVIDIPANTIKIDRAFLDLCMSSDRGTYLLRHVISIIKGLNYRVVCEGVESSQQLEILQSTDCEEVQGFLFARPMSIEEYEAFVYGSSDTEAAPLTNK